MRKNCCLRRNVICRRGRASTRAIILAASRGNELGEVTAGIPKAMVPVGGTPLLHKLVAQFRAAGVACDHVVRGYAAEKVHAPDVEFVENDDFEGTGELLSLHKARDQIDGDAIISFGDILFRQHILNNLLAEEHDIVIAVDAMWERRRERQADGYVDYVTATRPYSLRYDEEDAFLAEMGPDLSAGQNPWRMDRPDQNDSAWFRGDMRCVGCLIQAPGFSPIALRRSFQLSRQGTHPLPHN